MTAAEIADWSDDRAGLWPTMTLHAEAEPGRVLDVLAGNLDDAGWTIKDRSDTGFRARHVNLLDWAQLQRGLSLIEVAGAPGAGGGSDVSISVKKGGVHRLARRRGRAGLNAAVADLERQGVVVVVHPWIHN